MRAGNLFGSPFYLQCLGQGLAHTRLLININWMNELIDSVHMLKERFLNDLAFHSLREEGILASCWGKISWVPGVLFFYPYAPLTILQMRNPIYLGIPWSVGPLGNTWIGGRRWRWKEGKRWVFSKPIFSSHIHFLCCQNLICYTKLEGVALCVNSKLWEDCSLQIHFARPVYFRTHLMHESLSLVLK